jgi:hypothetical protein
VPVSFLLTTWYHTLQFTVQFIIHYNLPCNLTYITIFRTIYRTLQLTVPPQSVDFSGYGWSWFRLPAGATNSSLPHNVLTGCGISQPPTQPSAWSCPHFSNSPCMSSRHTQTTSSSHGSSVGVVTSQWHVLRVNRLFISNRGKRSFCSPCFPIDCDIPSVSPSKGNWSFLDRIKAAGTWSWRLESYSFMC